MHISGLCLYNGEYDHFHICYETLSSVCDSIFVFGEKKQIHNLSTSSKINFNICHLVPIKWNQNFSEVRNFAIDYIIDNCPQAEWIFSLDSDECIDKNERWKIYPYIQMSGNSRNFDAISFKIINNGQAWTSNNSFTEDSRELEEESIRIFKASKRLKYVGRINEKLSISPSSVKKLDINIFHHAYRYSEEEHLFLKDRQSIFLEWAYLYDEEKLKYIDREKKFYKNIKTRICKINNFLRKPIFGFFSLHFDPPLGGAERSMLNYFKDLENDIDIYVCCFLDDGGSRFKERTITEIGNIKIIKSNLSLDQEFKTFTENFHPDVVGTQLLYSDVFVGLAKSKSIPCLFFAHGLFEDICQHYLMKTCQFDNLEICSFGKHCPNGERIKNDFIKYSYCEEIFCNSEYIFNIFRRFYPQIENKIKIIPPNFNYDLFFPKENKIKTNKVLSVNSMRTKGRDIVIKLARMHPEIEFIYVDCKPQDISSLSSIKNIKIIESASREEMANLYQNVDVVLLPTFMSESFGGVACEAILSGVPVVASNKGNLRNIITDGENGFLINDLYNIKLWSEKLKQAMKMNANLSYINSLRKKINTRKATDTILNSIKKLYDQKIDNCLYILKD